MRCLGWFYLAKVQNVGLIRGRIADLIILGFGHKWVICFWACFASLGNMTHGEYLG